MLTLYFAPGASSMATLATKPKQGLAMLERARAAGVPFAWIAGDSVYGADSAIRRWAEQHRRGYVLAVTSGQRLAQRPVTTWIEDLPDAAWQRLSAGDGAKGPRRYDWAHLPYKCVFRRNQPVFPIQTSHLFRAKPAGHSDDPSRVDGAVCERVNLAYGTAVPSSLALSARSLRMLSPFRSRL